MLYSFIAAVLLSVAVIFSAPMGARADTLEDNQSGVEADAVQADDASQVAGDLPDVVVEDGPDESLGTTDEEDANEGGEPSETPEGDEPDGDLADGSFEEDEGSASDDAEAGELPLAEEPVVSEPSPDDKQDEGDAVVEEAPAPSTGHWEVKNLNDGTDYQRYWYDADGNLATDRLISPDEGAGYWAYATSDGRVVRGKFDNGAGYVYLADNDGRLASGSEWMITDFYDGEYQRYYLVEHLHAARTSYFSVGEANYFGLGGRGYVLRGVGRGVQDDWLVADNDGKLASCRWVVTDAFGRGLQRYWFDEKGCMAKARLVSQDEGADYWAYATVDGTILRGKMDSGLGFVYLADNDGRLASRAGWLVTGIYDGGVLQRYFISETLHAAQSGYFSDGDAHYFGLGGKGYTLRGAGKGAHGDLIFADNEGKLMASGWLVTSSFGHGLQRYWFENYEAAASRLIDEASAGYFAYARPEGYVVRGKYLCADGAVYLANNDGGLEAPGWHVTNAYDNGVWQRYWIDEETHACKSGLFTVGTEGYYGVAGKGYVLRGSLSVGADSYRADNDGMLILAFKSKVEDKKGVCTDVRSTFVGDTPYLFLPAHANLSNVPLGFTLFAGGSSLLLSLGNADAFDLYESESSLDLVGLEVRDGVRVLFFKTAESSKLRTLAIMVSADIGAMYLVSSDPVNQGRFYVDGSPDHTAKATGSMLFVNPDGSVVYNGELTQIKGRGNSTWWASDKRPYQIKLDKKTDLLETGEKSNKAKTWILLANANDATLLRNMVAFELAQALGLKGAPGCRPIDLYYDGEYRGSYLLSEKVEINGGRVDITKLEDDIEDANPGVDLDKLPLVQESNKYGNTFQYVQGVKDPEDFSGGYLLELDCAYYASERCWFGTSAGYFVVKGPENLSRAQMIYISELMQEAINSCNASNRNPQTGLRTEDYIDIDSFAKMYLLNEFSKNIDWSFSSTYFYLPSKADAKNCYDNVFYAGPAWDFDSAFGIRNNAPTVQDTNGLYYYTIGSVWYLDSPAIESSAKLALLSSLVPLVQEGLLGNGSGALQSIDSSIAMLAASQVMNHVLWEYASFENCVDPYPTYEQNAAYLKNWIAARINWLKICGWTA